VNNKHRAVLEAIFERPTRADIRWSEIEAMIIACGGEVRQREGSRVALVLNGVRSVFHRPHPQPTTKKGAIDAMGVFLVSAWLEP
jgi:hypothetical protein